MIRFAVLALFSLALSPAWSQTALPLSSADLIRDHIYISPSSNYFLIFRPDGDLVVVNTDGQIVWGLGGTGVSFQGSDRVSMQPDGNLAMYDSEGAILWSAFTAYPDPRGTLTISDDGDLQIVTEDGPVWSSRTGVIRSASPVEALIPATAVTNVEPDPSECAPADDAAGGTLSPGLVPSFLDDIACFEKLAHREANRAREQAGLDSLAWSDPFAVVARVHSLDMISRGYVSHDTPEGLTFSDRMEAGGLGCSGLRAENIAGAHAVGIELINEADEVVSVEWLPRHEIGSAPVVSWLNSPPHRRNLLNPDYTTHAIGIAWDADARMYRATQLFCE